MKILIEESVLRQALEALELAEYHLTPNINIAAKTQKPIADLRSAIEQADKKWKPDPNWIASLEKLMP